MYSFAQRSDCMVVDEPLYAHYLKKSNAKSYHPGAEDILKEMATDGEKVADWMKTLDSKQVIFFKNMTHHILDLELSFTLGMQNVILTRDPLEMLSSIIKLIPYPKMQDVGYAQQLDLISYLKKHHVSPIVLDSRDILNNPAQGLKKLCEACGIPYDRDMLSWPAGPIPEDGSWAKYWYKSVHQSTGFKKYSPKNEHIPESLIPLLEECNRCYQSLLKYAV
ncbi:MAG: sulfotransferase family protein [Bacteroidia bacterium]